MRRRVVLTVPYFMIAAMAAAETDCVAAPTERMANLCVQLLPLKRVRSRKATSKLLGTLGSTGRICSAGTVVALCVPNRSGCLIKRVKTGVLAW